MTKYIDKDGREIKARMEITFDGDETVHIVWETVSQLGEPRLGVSANSVEAYPLDAFPHRELVGDVLQLTTATVAEEERT